MSLIFDRALDRRPDDDLVIEYFHELHDWDDDVTQDHYGYIYDDYRYREFVYKSANPKAAARGAALWYIEKVIFGKPGMKCPACPRRP
jgi:hypothetical protein